MNIFKRLFLRTKKHCKFCGSVLYKSEIKEYAYQCLNCDEDFYSCEQ